MTLAGLLIPGAAACGEPPEQAWSEISGGEEMAVAVTDLPPPRVVLVLPEDAGLARPDVVVNLRFSTAMDVEASSEAFYLRDGPGETIAGMLSWDTTHMVIAFRPDTLLALGPHAIGVEASARSIDGVPLSEPFVAGFEVTEPVAEKNSSD